MPKFLTSTTSIMKSLGTIGISNDQIEKAGLIKLSESSIQEVAMVQKRTSDHTDSSYDKSHLNGLAKDANLAHTTEVVMNARPEIQGYLLLAGGAALILFAFGFLPMIKWLVVASGAALLLWGVVRSNIIGRTAQMIDRYRSRK